MIIVLVVIIVVIILIVRKNKKNVSYSDRNKKKIHINIRYESLDGNFIIKGTKNRFKIKKDNGLEFKVVDGQIVSVKDKKNKHIYEVD